MKFTKEMIMAMTGAELDSTVSEIRSRMNDADADLENFNEAMDWINERRSALEAEETRRREIRSRIAGGSGVTLRSVNAEPKAHVYGTDSPEYRSAFLKTMMDQDLSREERDAITYVATTTDATYGAGNVLPRQMLNRIWDLIDDQHAILGDISLYRTGTILEVAKRTAISQGDAATVNENAANDDEVNTFAKVTLSGKDFSKHVNISYAMAKMSVDAFEEFLTAEIADRLGAALAADVVTQIGTDFDSTNNAVTTTTAKKLTFAEVAQAMGTLKNANGQAVVYATRATIYNYLVGMVDTTGRPIFQMNAQNGAEGTLIGCPVKVEDAVAANVLYIGYPKQVVGNMIQDIMVESDKDIKKHVITYAGYARFECKLLAPKAFAKVTVKQS